MGRLTAVETAIVNNLRELQSAPVPFWTLPRGYDYLKSAGLRRGLRHSLRAAVGFLVLLSAFPLVGLSISKGDGPESTGLLLWAVFLVVAGFVLTFTGDYMDRRTYLARVVDHYYKKIGHDFWSAPPPEATGGPPTNEPGRARAENYYWVFDDDEPKPRHVYTGAEIDFMKERGMHHIEFREKYLTAEDLERRRRLATTRRAPTTDTYWSGGRPRTTFTDSEWTERSVDGEEEDGWPRRFADDQEE